MAQKLFLIGWVVVIVGAIFMFRFTDNLKRYTSTTPPARPPEPAVVLADGTRIESVEAIARCRARVQRLLLAPSTASFPSLGRTVLENNTWRHVVIVDAQNAFGAVVRSQFSCVIDGNTGTIDVRPGS